MVSDDFEDNDNDLGLRLKELRKKSKLRQKDVAAMLKVHINSVRHYEDNSQSPPYDNLRILAKLYKTTTDYLLGVDNRAVIYIDDLPETHQKLFKKYVEVTREALKAEQE